MVESVKTSLGKLMRKKWGVALALAIAATDSSQAQEPSRSNTGQPVPVYASPVVQPPEQSSSPATRTQIKAALEQTPSAADIAPSNEKTAPKPTVDPALRSAILEVLNERDAQRKSDEEAKKAQAKEEGYAVGSDLRVTASFKDGLFLWLETPNKDFTMHIGGWTHFDNVFWSQTPALRTPPGTRPGLKQGVASGVAGGGIGDLEDGLYFRRIRLFAEGTFFENGEYRLINAFENNQFSSAGFDEFWVGAKNIPLIGSARVGHVKNAIGLEGDMTASSRAMTFMERSSYSEAIELNQNFVTGLWLSDNYFDQRMTYSATLFRADQGASSGAYFGDGQYGAQGRLTALPIDENDGRHLMHIAVSGGWRNGQSTNSASPYRTFQLRARSEMRDDNPASSPGGAQLLPNANSNRMIDTGAIVARDEFLTGLEFLYILGPFSVQAEYGWNWINNASGIAPNGFALNPALAGRQNYIFSGGYLQIAYTLTGENRAYDRRIGTLAREYYGTEGPYTNAWFVRDENGFLNVGWGAWEIAARVTHTTLNDGSGVNTIQGGEMDGLSLGLNWYLNRNMNIMFDYNYNHRYGVSNTTIPGYTNGFGVEMQFQF